MINNIDKCVEYSKSIDKEIIIGSDTNAHSQLWRSKSDNIRGEVFQDIIALNNLVNHNSPDIIISKIL